MTRHQVIAAWLVFGLIALNLFLTSQWSGLWSALNGSGGSTGVSGPGATTGPGRKPGKKVNGTLTCPAGYRPDPSGTFCIKDIPTGM